VIAQISVSIWDLYLLIHKIKRRAVEDWMFLRKSILGDLSHVMSADKSSLLFLTESLDIGEKISFCVTLSTQRRGLLVRNGGQGQNRTADTGIFSREMKA
jgi:hypothetical protein